MTDSPHRGRRLVLACVIAASAAAIVVRPAAQTSATAPQDRDVLRDFYYFGNQRIALIKSETDAVVEFVPGAANDNRRAITGLMPSARVDRNILSAGRTFELVTLSPDATARDLGTPQPQDASLAERLRSLNNVKFVAPIYLHPVTRKRLLPTDEIIVRLRLGGTREELDELAASFGLEVVEPMWHTQDEFVLRLLDGAADQLAMARALHESGAFEWAEPNFIQEYEKSEIPNDPRFGNQWHLRNIGQGGGAWGADAKLTAAWDIEPGKYEIVIAVIDDGVDFGHEDFSPSMFINGADPPNGSDDDRNGLVDDYSGWDFVGNDNDAHPSAAEDNHGTAVAGVAAARANYIGGRGACPPCQIMSIKVVTGPSFATSSTLGNAIRYASTMADVLNNSWGGGAPSSAIQSAIQFATTTGRGGKGSVVLFAAGNAASGHQFVTQPFTIPPGTHRYRFEYSKDTVASAGNDTAWLSWILFPGSQAATFQGGLPAGWVTGGDQPWSVVSDPIHSDEGACLTRAARAGPITHFQYSYLETVKTTAISGTLRYFQWVSSESGYDGLRVGIDLNNNGSWDFISGLSSGVPAVATGISYPAAYPESIAVGATTNFDCRSHYSQYGPELDLVAPSSGGFFNLGIDTTDRMGSAGYTTGNYFSGFGGTSAATPLVAGIAGLMLSRNPDLTAAEVREILLRTTDEVGLEPNLTSRDDRYGFGRVNAHRAVRHAAEGPRIQTQPASQIINPGQRVVLSVGATSPLPLYYQWYFGPSGRLTNPAGAGTENTFTVTGGRRGPPRSSGYVWKMPLARCIPTRQRSRCSPLPLCYHRQERSAH